MSRFDAYFAAIAWKAARIRPASDQPGTEAEQLAAIDASLYLGRRRRTDARHEWDDARALVIPHANEVSTV